MRKSLMIYGSVALLVGGFATVTIASATEKIAAFESVEAVEKLHDTLLEVMRSADSLGFEGRYETLTPVVTEVYDLPLIARLTVGRRWGEFDEKQRTVFADALLQLTVATYADRFDGYSGQSFEILQRRSLRDDRDLVTSVLIPSKKKDKVRFDYVLRRSDGHWRIINVITRGVSEVALKRSQYSEFLSVENHGPEDLIAELKDLIRYRTEHATEKARQQE